MDDVGWNVIETARGRIARMIRLRAPGQEVKF